MRQVRVLVQREMESGRAPLASITPIPRGQFAPPEAVAAWRKGASGRNRNWFHKKGNQGGGSHSQQVALRSGKQLARKRVSNTRTAKLLNKQACRCHHAGAFVLRELQPKRRRAFSFRIGRHPAAIRTGTSTTWLHRWAMYSRMSSGPSWSVERWKYCSDYTPMSSDHGCERLSHDQPIVLSRP